MSSQSSQRSLRARGLWHRYSKALLLLFLVVAVYSPAMRAGFIWDDAGHVGDKPALASLGGFFRMWLVPGAVQQYYPLTHTSFWLLDRLVGQNPFPYHLLNIVLHAVNALLLVILLRLFRLRCAWWVGFVFALHPVHVETVAWISELKNLQSTLFFLLGLLAYRRFGLGKSALGLYIGALLSKTVTCVFPVVVGFLEWWKKGHVSRAGLLRLAPFFLVGACAGLGTVWIERQFLEAVGGSWSIPWQARCLVAGRAVWFYAGKLVYPEGLAFIYPRWSLVTTHLLNWSGAVAIAATLALLWLRRELWGRGPFVAVVLYVAALFPALGFFNVYPMRYSFVADHFQYLASMPLLTLIAEITHRFFRRLPRNGRPLGVVLGIALLYLLGYKTWERSHVFHSSTALWQDVLQKDPENFMAHNNLGVDLMRRAQWNDAEMHFRAAHQSQPTDLEPLANLGRLYEATGRYPAAEGALQQAIQIDPQNPAMRGVYGALLLQMKHWRQAIEQLNIAVLIGEKQLRTEPRRKSMTTKKNMAIVMTNIAVAYEQLGDRVKAKEYCLRALDLEPGFAPAQALIDSASFQR